jgi:hypothetical protein
MVFAENLGATLAENLVDSGVIDIDLTASLASPYR